jgi:hypothetical protein
MHSNDQVWSNSYDQVNLNLAWQVGVKCMLFMDEIESKVSMHSSNQVNTNLTWQVEANCMSFVAWNQFESKHASNSNQNLPS